jgi:glycosyltransferase involved in cell wall biosynthesis
MKRTPRICLTPRLNGVGGMVSFQHKFAAGLAVRGVEFTYDLADPLCQAVLVIGGTRQLGSLWQARRRGALIVQRLNGMNWMHRLLFKQPVATQGTGGAVGLTYSLRHFIRSEYGNFILSIIRAQLAQRVVYQSEFSRRWWERVYSATRVPNSVVYNGVDLQIYTPAGVGELPTDVYRVLMVEGNLAGGYESGLESGVRLVELLNRPGLDRPVELMVAGKVSEGLKRAWEGRTKIRLHWAGLIPQAEIPALDRSAHLLYSADLNAACPNSVVEALACGLPVAAFDTGALAELAPAEAGRVVPYGGDPWKLDPPDIPGLAQATQEILRNQEGFRAGARRQAEAALGLDSMVEDYLKVLLEQ